METKRTVVPEIKCFANNLRRFIAQTAAEYGLSDLTGQQMHIICYIGREQKNGKDVFQRDIESKLNVRPSTATVMLKVLEKNGYLSRESIPSDARLKKIVLTEKAEKVKANALPLMTAVEKTLTENISDSDINTFFDVIDKMNINLSININEKPSSGR